MKRQNKYSIYTLEQCTRLLDEFRADGRHLWQTQYMWNMPEGFHAWFAKADSEDIEVITHDKNVQKTIIQFHS